MHMLDAFKAELRGAPMVTELPCKTCLDRTTHYALGRKETWQSWCVYECSICMEQCDVSADTGTP